MFTRKRVVLLIPLVGTWTFAAGAQAVQYTFENITGNDPVDAAIGEAQMFLDVTDAGSNQVLFTYSNIGAQPCSLTDIYIDDGTLLAIALIINDPGLVEFSQYPAPPDLAGGETLVPPFEAEYCLSADADPPPAHLGINPGETLAILYNLENGGTFANVIAELADGTLRVGLHVQAYASGGSESFVNVPEPISLALFGLSGLALLHRRRP